MEVAALRSLAQSIQGIYDMAVPVINDFRAGNIEASSFADQMADALKVASDTAGTLLMGLPKA